MIRDVTVTLDWRGALGTRMMDGDRVRVGRGEQEEDTRACLLVLFLVQDNEWCKCLFAEVAFPRECPKCLHVWMFFWGQLQT